jgi:hypothetical protein
MKFLDQAKIILKLEMVVLVQLVLEEKNLLNMVDQMVEMVEMVVQLFLKQIEI